MTLAERLAAAPAARRFTRREFDLIARTGVFDDQRVELVDGEIIATAPQNEPHSMCIAHLIMWLAPKVVATHTLRCQAPLIVNDVSKPEPDFAVVRGVSDAQKGDPVTADLVIEVSDTSSAHDLKKRELYAAAGVAEYWVLNLRDRRLEVYRRPIDDGAKPGAKRYDARDLLGLDDTVACESLPFPRVRVRDLFPRVLLEPR